MRVNFSGFEDMLEIHEVIFEIYIRNKLANKQTMQAPKDMLIANFMQVVQQISNDRRPMKIKMIKPETIWDRFENKQKILNNEVSFSNNAMISFEGGNE